VLTDGQGRRHADVTAVRAFPLSAPREGIALCDADGRELAWIDDLDGLPAPARRLVEDELARGQFLPVLCRIVRVSAPTEPSEWEVETDRGPTRFVLNSDEDVRRLDAGRAMVVDAQGMRYLIPDPGALDAESRRILERYL
jgi:hypothetical protein